MISGLSKGNCPSLTSHGRTSLSPNFPKRKNNCDCVCCFQFSCFTVCWVLSHLSSLAQSPPVAPPQAQVTFYSGGSLLKSQIPADKHGTFVGRIMDGHQQLAMLMPDRFVTFNLDPGEHILAANGWVRGDPVGRGHLKNQSCSRSALLRPGLHGILWWSPHDGESSNVPAKKHKTTTKPRSP